MKFLLLLWTEPSAGDHEADGFGTEEDYRAWTGFEARLRSEGSYVDSGDLDPAAGTLVRPSIARADLDLPGTVAAGGHLAGYYVVEAADRAAAEAIAAAVPLHGVVELRPVVEHGD